MGLQEVINGEWGVKFALNISRILPLQSGYWLARLIATCISKGPENTMLKAVKANQWVIAGQNLSKKELQQKSNAVYQSSGKCIFDLYRNIKSPQGILDLVQIPPETKRILTRISNNEPTIFAMPHLSNFDLAGQALALLGYRVQILSLPSPGKGYQLQNQLREQAGWEVTPISIQALRQARNHLRQGGCVMTGMDRPVGETRHRPIFFGRPSVIPVAYIRLAMEEKVPVVVMSCITLSNGSYQIISSDPFPMDTEKDLFDNAENILRYTEILIKRYPDQWGMYYPVWPEALTEIP